LLTSCDADTIEPHIYIALGDSVSSGYGLAGYKTSPEERHTTIFFEMLKDGGYVDEYINMAVSGLTTTTLLQFLYEIDDERLDYFQNARIITLNIGGNNVLMPFLEYLSDLQIVSGASSIRTGADSVLIGAWGIVYELATGVGSVLSDYEEAELGVDGIILGIGNILSGIGEIIVGSGDVIAGSSNVVSTWRGSLSPELESILNEGVQTFSDEFIEIIEWLEANAPNATIIVNTIYNPIPQEILTASVAIYNWANILIESMNNTIIEESKEREYLVTDVSAYLSNQFDMMNFNLDPSGGDLSLDIIHPNALGHNLIAQLNYLSLRQHIDAEILENE